MVVEGEFVGARSCVMSYGLGVKTWVQGVMSCVLGGDIMDFGDDMKGAGE